MQFAEDTNHHNLIDCRGRMTMFLFRRSLVSFRVSNKRYTANGNVQKRATRFGAYVTPE